MQAGKVYSSVWAYLSEVNAPISPEEAARAMVAEQQLYNAFVVEPLRARARAAANAPARHRFTAPAAAPTVPPQSLAHPSNRLPDFDIF